MGPQFIVINCGYLLDMMGMPGMLAVCFGVFFWLLSQCLLHIIIPYVQAE